MSRHRALGVKDLVLMNLAAIIALRWIALAATAGPSALTLWLFAAVCFFVPQAFAVAELAARFDDQGGLYAWVNNLFYIPSLLIVLGLRSIFVRRGGRVPATGHAGERIAADYR